MPNRLEKQGVSIIPIDREPLGTTSGYGDDRIFAFIGLGGDEPLAQGFHDMAAAGHPAVMIEIGEIGDLGQEFFRWEFATAIAGSVMKIDPFNQPDVESAKIESRKITDEYEQTGELPDETPFIETEGISLSAGVEYANRLMADATELTLKGILNAHLNQIGPGDYFALLGYIEMNSENDNLLQTIREKVRRRTGVATCLGFGPRFLHSTGQAYKGGANNGVFLQITSDDMFDLPVPGQKYTFGVVKSAQARGDFQVLVDRDRRALRIHFKDDLASGLELLTTILS